MKDSTEVVDKLYQSMIYYKQKEARVKDNRLLVCLSHLSRKDKKTAIARSERAEIATSPDVHRGTRNDWSH